MDTIRVGNQLFEISYFQLCRVVMEVEYLIWTTAGYPAYDPANEQDIHTFWYHYRGHQAHQVEEEIFHDDPIFACGDLYDDGWGRSQPDDFYAFQALYDAYYVSHCPVSGPMSWREGPPFLTVLTQFRYCGSYSYQNMLWEATGNTKIIDGALWTEMHGIWHRTEMIYGLFVRLVLLPPPVLPALLAFLGLVGFGAAAWPGLLRLRG